MARTTAALDKKGYQPYSSIRITQYAYNAIHDILPALKAKDKNWSMSRFINVATYDFIKRFSQQTDADLARLFQEYEDKW